MIQLMKARPLSVAYLCTMVTIILILEIIHTFGL